MEQTGTVLVVDQDVQVRGLLNYLLRSTESLTVVEAADGPMALGMYWQAAPDLVILDLNLPGLSGRDVLVALKSQGYAGPIIILADKEHQQAAQDTLRLGATDALRKPLREPEVLTVVERALAGARLRQQRDALIDQVQATHEKLEAKTGQLDALYMIGQMATTLPKLDVLFQQVLQCAISVTGADYAMVLMLNEANGQLTLQAGQNLPIALLDRQGETLADEMAEMVISTREMLLADIDLLRQFGTARGIYAAIYAPLVVQHTAFGALMVGNHQRRDSFTVQDEQLMRGLANYAALAVLNVRLTHILTHRTNAMKAAYQQFRARDAEREQHLNAVLTSMHQPLIAIEGELLKISQQMTAGQANKLTSRQLIALSQQVRLLITKVNALTRPK